MKKIIKGKTYNTDTAQLISQCDFYKYGLWSSCAELYKTRRGTYFIYRDYDICDKCSPATNIQPITPHEAQCFVERHGTTDEYIAEWGEPEEA